ncbi:hypothetical protein ACS0TY_023446 [Phlomoides rotata]
METLNTTESCLLTDDYLLNFTFNEEEDTISKGASQTSPSFETAAAATAAFSEGSLGGSFPEFAEEEELEWLSNKDAFPSVETCFGILADNPELILHHQSPVSVLENSISSTNSNSNGGSLASCCNSLKVPINYPVRARSKRRRRRRSGFGHFPMLSSQVNFKNKHELPFSLPPSPIVSNSGASLGRRCLHCQADKTPQWRAGPMGPKTLCNACGVRYKSGRLLPEYRPANSPTYSSTKHSNSHRKVVEMRKQKLGGDGGGGDGIGVNVACGYRVG